MDALFDVLCQAETIKNYGLFCIEDDLALIWLQKYQAFLDTGEDTDQDQGKENGDFLAIGRILLEDYFKSVDLPQLRDLL